MKSFNDVLEYLDSLINYEVEFPLGGTRDQPKLEPVLKAVGVLQLSVRLPKCLHIAGTVGKGSTAAMSQAMLSVNHSVLSFTSPHLVSPKERVQLDGRNLSESVWSEGIAEIRDGMAVTNTKLTYFETMFVFYLWCARKLGTTAHVVETGLGGRFDATNVLIDTTAVFTKIDYDHTYILGKTLKEIAKDKSGIIKPGMNCFSTFQASEALEVIEHTAREQRAQLFVEERDFSAETCGEKNFCFKQGERKIEDILIPLGGEFQRHNLAVAMAAVLSLDPTLNDLQVRRSLFSLKLSGRQQTLEQHPNVMIDVCHNPASFAELSTTLKKEERFDHRIALVSMMKDKDARASLQHFVGVVDELWVTTAPTPRSFSAEALLAIASELSLVAKIVEREAAYQKILRLSANTQGIVCGSFYLIGDFLKEHGDA